MKCSKCGREFGNGANCQYCGIDRVTGLGNYSGYDKPSGSYEPNYSSSNNGGYASNTMVCYACSEIIPKDSIYCPACGRQLWVECPNCGSTYSTQYKICSKCGTNREEYFNRKEAEEQLAQLKKEAREIEENLSPGNVNTFLLFCFIGLIIGFVIWNNIWGLDNFGDYMVSGWTGGASLGALYSFVMSYCKGKNIEKWKEEHPNDPRSKYL